MRVRFTTTTESIEKAIERPGQPLQELCGEDETFVRFLCRRAHCGTCRIRIISGEEGMSRPNDSEIAVLRSFGDSPENVRLACQVKLNQATDVLQLCPPDDEFKDDEK